MAESQGVFYLSYCRTEALLTCFTARSIGHGQRRGDDDASMLDGNVSPVNYVINGHTYIKGYYVDDRVYPQWSTIVKIICDPYLKNKQWFAKCHESFQKDVE
jgi:hypothetical protein